MSWFLIFYNYQILEEEENYNFIVCIRVKPIFYGPNLG